MASKYNKEFVADISKFTTKTENRILDARKTMAYDIFSRVIDRTPIWFYWEDGSGNTKYNWQCTVGTLSTRVLKGVDNKKGTVTKKRMQKVVENVQGDETIYFSNSVPWIFNLEDGLYPKSVSKGSWNSRTKKYEVRTVGGFSTQAPKGMVKLTLAEYPNIYKRAIRTAKSANP